MATGGAPIHEVAVPGARGWFSGRRLPGVDEANLAHHRPHIPAQLDRARASFAVATGTDHHGWHLMRQVHGAEVAVVDAATPRGAELRGVDALVTASVDTPLVVLVADCLPVLLLGEGTVAAVHAGWRGLAAGVAGATVATMLALGERADTIAAAIGPAIGPCCYEVGPEVVEAVTSRSSSAVATRTSWGTPSVDLRAAVVAQLEELGVRSFAGPTTCTRCHAESYFSHRADPRAGRQAGLVVRTSSGT